jgi:hypothetical protein
VAFVFVVQLNQLQNQKFKMVNRKSEISMFIQLTVIELLGKVCKVSVETMKIVKEMT